MIKQIVLSEENNRNFLFILQHFPFLICIQVRTKKKVTKSSPKMRGRTTMKKLIAIILSAVIAISVAACSNNSTSKDNLQKRTTGDQIPNPWVDCKTITDAEKNVGFTLYAPEKIPIGYTQEAIRTMEKSLFEIIYVNGKNELRFRQGKGSKDISSDYNEYKESNTMTVGNLQVTTKGDNGKVSLATWTDGGYAFAISADGLDNTAISDMISSVKSDAGIGDDDEIPNPFIDCATMADAKKTAGFTVTVPSKMPEGYVQDLIQAVKNEMVQVFYKNGEKEILIRKAKGSEDISGDYNEYKESNTITAGSLKVFTRGNDGKVNTVSSSKLKVAISGTLFSAI